MTAMVGVHHGGSLLETQREAELWKHLDRQSWGLAFSLPLIQLSRLWAAWWLTLLLSLAAPGEGTDALPQAAKCADCPGFPQAQTGSVTDRDLMLLSSLCTFLNLKLISVCAQIWLFQGQTGQHQERRHRRRKPKADPGADMDHHPPLPGNEGHFYRTYFCRED